MVFFVIKQKTAYEMRFSDWSSEVCSSDLALADRRAHRILAERLGNQEGRLDAAAGQQAFGKGGDEDRRHRGERQYVLHRVDPRRPVGKLDIGEHQPGVALDRKSVV